MIKNKGIELPHSAIYVFVVKNHIKYNTLSLSNITFMFSNKCDVLSKKVNFLKNN